ncbi:MULTISPECIES: hypothetical protein [unclassified Variovorax]|uniref:hypothetical protein n=1 Tax=unclassified Variovorax TaxID=663243 RepID=UPI00076DB9B3|nr:MULTISPECIES: hypothetical protein [unclassified Variovorax]KWT98105.1 hypothetical protein APY03_0776 [Variovorax sp. WDL1]PNG50419.1 hypothetical protein CHC06_06043 [Variovorax sp. B2]PNG51292.1 hypothetical protein CHC07_05949 [Variovorax sp. B4]VTV17547.1 hypothetical protein WDL1P1_00475 [Variovorax sp. WDL1]
MTPTEYRNERRRLSASLNRLLRAHLIETGFREGPIGRSKPVKAWVPRGKGSPGLASFQTFVLRGGFVVKEFMGFVQGGVIVDCANGGLSTLDFGDMPLEDLFRLNVWAERQFAPAPGHVRKRA